MLEVEGKGSGTVLRTFGSGADLVVVGRREAGIVVRLSGVGENGMLGLVVEMRMAEVRHRRGACADVHLRVDVCRRARLECPEDIEGGASEQGSPALFG